MLPFLPFIVLLLAGAILMALRFVQLRRALLRARAGEAQFRLLAEHGRDAAFLLDARSGFVTGQVISVDGGFMATGLIAA